MSVSIVAAAFLVLLQANKCSLHRFSACFSCCRVNNHLLCERPASWNDGRAHIALALYMTAGSPAGLHCPHPDCT